MSIKAISHIWDHANASGGELLVLLALADHANDDGACWPGISLVAKKSRMSERNVQRIIQKLQSAGQLTIDSAAGPRGTNFYRIPMGGDNLSGVTQLCHRGGDILGAKGVTPMSPEPSVQPSGNRKGSSPASQASHLHLVDDDHIQSMKRIFQPQDVDRAVAKCKAWLTTPCGRGKAFTKKRLNTFLRDAEPIGIADHNPERRITTGASEEPPSEFCLAYLLEQFPDSREDALNRPFKEQPNDIQKEILAAFRKQQDPIPLTDPRPPNASKEFLLLT